MFPAPQARRTNAGYGISPHLRVYANATNLFDQPRFQVYRGSVIGRRVPAGMTSTFQSPSHGIQATLPPLKCVHG